MKFVAERNWCYVETLDGLGPLFEGQLHSWRHILLHPLDLIIHVFFFPFTTCKNPLLQSDQPDRASRTHLLISLPCCVSWTLCNTLPSVFPYLIYANPITLKGRFNLIIVMCPPTQGTKEVSLLQSLFPLIWNQFFFFFFRFYSQVSTLTEDVFCFDTFCVVFYQEPP